MRNSQAELDLGEAPLDASRRVGRPSRWPVLAVGVGVLAAAALLVGGGDRERDDPDAARPPVERLEVVETIETVRLYSNRGLDDVVIVGLPLGEDSGILVELDSAAGTIERRTVDGEEWPDDISDRTHIAAYPDAEGAARSPDGAYVAVFTRSGDTRQTGIAIYAEGVSARRFHRLQSVAVLVSGRIVWSPDSDAIYFLAADDEGSADRLLGIPLDGTPRTVATFAERGFYGLAVRAAVS